MIWLIVFIFIDWMVFLKVSLGMVNLKIFFILVEVSVIFYCRVTGVWNFAVFLLRLCCRTVSSMLIFRFWVEYWFSSIVIRKRIVMLWFYIVFSLILVFVRRKIGFVVLKVKDFILINLVIYVIILGLI